MENVSFTFEDAQRISDSVLANERSKYAVKPVDYTSQGDEFVVINVTATTKFSDDTQDGNLSYWNESTKLYAAYDPVQTVRVRAANTADTLPTGYVFARFQGNTTRSGVVGPLYIAVSVRPASGGNAVIEVVTDVICTPTGIEVSTVTLSGADYDNAVIRQFLGLSDVTPSSYLGNQNRIVMVNAAATALEFGPSFAGTPSAVDFLGLTDTPDNYSGANLKSVTCTASGLVFTTPSVTTTNSITGGGNPNSGFTTMQLINDSATPGNNKYYGTSASGVKGWQSIQALLDAIDDLTTRVELLEAP
jgi:hypothetical protein